MSGTATSTAQASVPAGQSVYGSLALEKIVTREDETPSPTHDRNDGSAPPLHSRIYQRWQRVYAQHSFLILVVCAILIAYAYPPLGATYLYPQITATWIAVLFIFTLAGMGIKTEEFAKAFQRFRFNAFVQLFNLGAVSGIVFGFSRLMIAGGILPQSLADGMTICASLPITVNMVLVLTKSAGGDEAAAVFNAAFGNLLGVFASPALILGYLGVSGQVDLANVFFKLGLKVVLPIFVGQILQKFVPPVQRFVKKYKKYFKKAQEYCLIFIVYTVFCKTFLTGSDVGAGSIFIMIAMQFLMLSLVMTLAWAALRILFRNEPKLQAMGLFGCTHKTVAMGIPLINAIYEGNPMVGLYTLPLLIWHPMQLVLGTAVAPRVAAYVRKREGELGKESGQNGPPPQGGGEEEAAAARDAPPRPDDNAVLMESGSVPVSTLHSVA